MEIKRKIVVVGLPIWWPEVVRLVCCGFGADSVEGGGIGGGSNGGVGGNGGFAAENGGFAAKNGGLI